MKEKVNPSLYLDFNPPPLSFNGTAVQKINEDIGDLNSTSNQWHLMTVIEHFTQNSIIYIPCKCPENVYQIDYVLDHKTNLNNYERTKIIQRMFFDHNVIKLEINNKKITGKSQNT